MPRVKAKARRLRRLARLALALVAIALGLELGLRWLVLGTSDLARRLGAPLRRAELWADARGDGEYWQLQALFAGESAGWPHPDRDPELGWLRSDLDPRTLAHPDEERVGARRPVLLLGDSFAECATPPEDCWQGLLERDPLGARFALLNYGNGGYGLGQILLLARRALERWRGRDPLVVVGILVDDDLDRSWLALRNFPKPRFRLEQGRLVLEPPGAPSAKEQLALRPLAIRSLLWRALLYQCGLPGRARGWLTGEARRVEEKRALNRALLEALEEELDARGLEHFYLLFHAQTALHQEVPFRWQEPLLYEALGALGAPFVSSRRALLEAMAERETGVEHFFLASGPGRNHYTAEGNAAVFRALRDGLEGRFEPAVWMQGAPPHPKERRHDGR